MNLWQSFEVSRETKYENQGISFHYQKGLDADLKKKYISFAAWLRKNYIFPVHVNVYILNCTTIRLINGKTAYGSFRYFPKRNPFIRIPSAVESELLNEYTIDEIHEQILSSLVHELSHYYQWILGADQSNAASEWQANYFRYKIIEKYYNGSTTI